MAAAVGVPAGLALVLFALINKTIGWDFYMNANGAFWSNIFYGTEVAIPVWPYPVQFAPLLTSTPALPFPGVLCLVVRLVGAGLPLLDACDLRRGPRPDAPRVGIEDRHPKRIRPVERR